MRHVISRKESILFAVLLCFVFAMYAAPLVIGRIGSVYERTVYVLFPSAQRAYSLGNQHLDAPKSRDYDPDRAEFFFKAALKMDPSHPYVRHQLARIAFLEGNLHSALMLINEEIALPDGPASPSSYYVKGLIEGFIGLYDEAAKDYATYLQADPKNWAAINDYAWVLLKGKRYEEALSVLSEGIQFNEGNPWLYNSLAVTLYELGRLEEAQEAITKAAEHVAAVTEKEWLKAYPGNDPLIAPAGVQQFRDAITANIRMIEEALEEQ